MENTAPIRALTRRSTQLLQIGFVVMAGGLFVTVISLLFGTVRLIPPSHGLFDLYILAANLLFWVGIILLVVGIGLMVRAFTRRRENDLALATGNALAEHLDGRFTFIRNINPPGLAYIDAVLLGPPGILVFRILDNEGVFANEAGNWLTHNRRGEWAPLRFNPTKQAIDDVEHLRKYLAKRKLGDVPVFGVIVFLNDEPVAKIFPKEPVVPVSHLSSLIEDMRKDYLSKPDRIPQETVSTIRRLLLEGK